MAASAKLFFVVPIAAVFIAVAAVLLMPRSTYAEAGSGGGGGSDGCSAYNYSTCFGAVWRYYKTDTDAYPIKNVGAGSTYATGCARYGGFFAYVLPHKNYPYDRNMVRSWQIGPVDGEWGNRSEFFGGWTHYRVYSNPSDPIPTNPVDGGDYSWYAVEKAFNQAKALGQTSGYDWNAWSDLGWFCYQGLNYTLTPSITVNPPVAEGGSTVTVQPTVANGGTTSSSNNQWQVTTFTLTPGTAIPAGGINGSTPVNHYRNGAAVIASGTQSFPRPTYNIPITPQVIGDLPVGSKVCYTLSVQPRSHADTQWSHSTPACVTVSKKPKVQVLGGDLLVGRGSAYNSAVSANIITSATTKSGATFGSWGEYALVPSGTVTGMASGSGYVGGSVVADLCSLSVLTFTSGSASGHGCGTIGNYTQATIAPNISARFPINVSAASATPGVPANPAVLPSTSVDLVGDNLAGPYQAPAGATALTITGGTPVPRGRWIVVNAPNATVTITGNITYTGEVLTSLSDIPQVVIIAQNIIIADGVTQIDAWLVTTGTGAQGRINTCGTGVGITETSALTYQQCTDKLLVNGPVIANHLILRRTAGSGTGAESGNPAEVFNLRGDAYLWAVNYNLGLGRLPTVANKELPPRY